MHRIVVSGTVLVSAGVRSSTRVLASARRARGFSLIELMVVIIIIGIVSALAVPTMLASRLDRNAYDDAGAVMQLLREARTRAIARGSAIMISMTANSTIDRGTFMMYEAVSANAESGGQNRTPVATCKTPTNWAPLDPTNPAANPGVVFIDGVNLNGSIESDSDIETVISQYDGTATTNVTSIFVCFTPLGHVYAVPGAAAPTAGMFDGAMPNLEPIEIRVSRMQGTSAYGTVRSVVLPPNGLARLFSHIPS